MCVNERFTGNKPSCGGRGSQQLAVALEKALADAGASHISLQRIKCFGRCYEGPNIRLAPGGRFWRDVKIEDIDSIVAEVVKETEP